MHTASGRIPTSMPLLCRRRARRRLEREYLSPVWGICSSTRIKTECPDLEAPGRSQLIRPVRPELPRALRLICRRLQGSSQFVLGLVLWSSRRQARSKTSSSALSRHISPSRRIPECRRKAGTRCLNGTAAPKPSNAFGITNSAAGSGTTWTSSAPWSVCTTEIAC
jgi:hypothetical protein